ncbi:MAG TPA: hypothetical protein PKY77_05745 [Phycisphaerae bacterium]|nr:hypothetical protein [Phycisphaerae bacterium]HRY69053.1 hypothetical protein [Phycisphaerae bacterium]HSA25972.1 hypothetical protein [Phycisphaerae bacterium]
MAVAVVSLVDGASLWQQGREQGVTRMRWETHPELVKEVCEECLYYNQTVWDIDDPNAPEPPLHPGCACQMVPEFDEGTVLGQDPDGNPIVTESPPIMQPGEWLARTSDGLNDEHQEHLEKRLGKARAAKIVRQAKDHYGEELPEKVVPSVERYAEGRNPNAVRLGKAPEFDSIRVASGRLEVEDMAMVNELADEAREWADKQPEAIHESFGKWSDAKGWFCTEIRKADRAGATGDGDADRACRELNRAFDKAPKYRGDLYRGLMFKPDQMVGLGPGYVIELNAMASFSKSAEVAADFAGMREQGMLIAVKAKSGIDIGGFNATVEAEQEVIMRRGSRMRVHSVQEGFYQGKRIKVLLCEEVQ